MLRRIFLTITILSIVFKLSSQQFFINDWSSSGLREEKFLEDEIINVIEKGADSSGLTNCDQIIQAIINEKVNRNRILFFPKGNYSFSKSININRDKLVIRGEGEDTQLNFNLNSSTTDCIRIAGTLSADTSIITSEGSRGLKQIKVYNSSKFKKADWIRLQCQDSAYMFSDWARGSLGQILQIDSITPDNHIILSGTLRFNYRKDLSPFLRKINPRSQVGIECLSIKRQDATTSQTSNIAMDYCVNSWIEGIHSNLTNFAHVALSYCAHTQVLHSYFHHSHAYGGGGQGYGVVLQFASSQCRVENNNFEHLRHAVLFQAGSNGNVVAFNYMIDPFWSQTISPSNSAGDIVLHGNYTFSNLIEGNINQNTIVDNSHGLNGPFNTFYRNRMELYGLIVSNNSCVDSLLLIENEITNSSLGFYLPQGKGHFENANKVKGVTTPSSTSELNYNSLFLEKEDKPLCYYSEYSFPYIGKPNSYNQNIIPAKVRYQNKKYILCSCERITTLDHIVQLNKLKIFPNPAQHKITIHTNQKLKRAQVQNLNGDILITGHDEHMHIESLPSGIYIIKCSFENGKTGVSKIVKP